ncbi:hypothetical protein [Desulfotomaculum copahuensis]|uniref:Uncharacterized protein n=1 Tax=Desulfotomaculum copahuensis TaxID=1838280 RepID=A0A1B7LFH7_9FIRM|nr:hypothetical protein [Desulfotomaculum copahuensis]OAT82919.1 hypothetical protein A6M21_08470 [Desulfotomaculum copahuensis]
MLERYCQLVEELNSFNRNQMGDLSTEEIMHYLDLRFEQEKLAGKLQEFLPAALLHLQDLVEQAREALNDVPAAFYHLYGEDYTPGESLFNLIRLTGSLENKLENAVADCSFLREQLIPAKPVVAGKEQVDVEMPDSPPWQEAEETGAMNSEKARPALLPVQVMEEVACAGEAVLPAPVERDHSGEPVRARTGLNEVGCSNTVREQQKNNGRTKPEAGIDVSPDTVKKLEAIIHPRHQAAASTPAKQEKEKGEGKYAVLKITSSGEGKTKNGKSKERRR